MYLFAFLACFYIIVCAALLLMGKFIMNHKHGRKNIFNINYAVLLIALCLLAGMMSGCGVGAAQKSDEAEELTEIIVGSDNYPPFNYKDADDTPTGIDVDLATEAFRRLGYKPIFVTIDWEKKKELLDSGVIDCIWVCFSIDGREELYNWTEPYMYSTHVVAVRKDSDIYTLADLAGKRIAVQSTTKPEEIFLSHSDPRIPEINELFSLHNRELIYPYLSKGYVDAIAAHEISILQCMTDYNLDYRILDETLQTVGLGAAFSKNDDRGLNVKLSKVFEEMRNDGTMEAIAGKYIAEPKKYIEGNGYAEK